MTNIYDQHDAAFRHVSAWVILKDGDRVAKIAVKFPRDGAGRLYAYVHWLGLPMVRGHAGGYGYDKQSAAIEAAARKLGDWNATYPTEATIATYEAFRNALSSPKAIHYWYRELEDAGFTVFQAI